MVNATSSLIAFCSSDKAQRGEVERFQHLIVRLMSMLYCAGLQQVALVPDDKLEIIDNDGMDTRSLSFLADTSDRTEVVLQWVQRLIVENMTSGVIQIPAPILSRVFQELSRGVVNIHNVRKIAEIPFPFPYTQMIIVMLTIQSVVTPILTSMSSETAWWAGLITFVTVLSYWCMNYIASEIEQPFGEDYNDLPIPDMLRDMNRSLRTLMLREAQMPPEFDYQREKHEMCECVTCHAAQYNTHKNYVVGFTKSREKTIRKIESALGGRCSRRTSFASGGGDGMEQRRARISREDSVTSTMSRFSALMASGASQIPAPHPAQSVHRTAEGVYSATPVNSPPPGQTKGGKYPGELETPPALPPSLPEEAEEAPGNDLVIGDLHITQPWQGARHLDATRNTVSVSCVTPPAHPAQ